MSAGQRDSHAAILRGIAGLFLLCELASRAGVMPSLLRGGLAPLLELPFFAPSLLGAFAAQLVLRPRREELLVTAGAAALLALPVFAVAAGRPWAIVNTICASLGLAALVSLGGSAFRRSGSEREEVLEVLRPALILPGFVSLAHPLVYLTAVLWPTTYDHRMYAADWALGGPLSFTIARWTAAVPMLAGLCLVVYVCLPLALMLVHAARQKRSLVSSDALVAFVAVTVVGYVGYHVVPVTGPGYVFGAAFPLSPPDLATLGDARAVALPMPRNCMPSLHSAWALLVWWNARPLPRLARAAATAFFAITLLATVALGFHYVVDLVAAFPLTLAAQAWATSVSDARRRRIAIAAGSAMTVAWIAAVTWSDVLLALPAPLLWLLAAGVVGVSSWLERGVYDVRSEHTTDRPEAEVSPSMRSRVAVPALFLLGLAGWLHEAILFHALAPVVGATSETRTAVTLTIVAAFAGGSVAGSRLAPDVATRVAALAAIALPAWSWLVLKLVPPAIGAPGDAASAGVLLAIALAAPAALATGLVAPSWSRSRGWLAPVLLGAACGALAAGYAVLPTTRSALLPVLVYVLVAVAAVRIAVTTHHPAAGDAPAASLLPRPGMGMPLGLLLALVCGLVLATEAHLATAMLGDTVYARCQVAALLGLGLAAGAFVSERHLDRDESLAWICAALAASVVVTMPLWNGVPGYFASFRGYIDRYDVMGEFGQHEFIRFCAAALFLVPPALCAGAAAAPRSLHATTPAFTLLGVAGAAIAAFVLLPLAGSRASLSISAALAIVLAAIALRTKSEVTRRSVGVTLAGIAAAALVFANRLDAAGIASESALTLRPSRPAETVTLAESAAGIAVVESRSGALELRVNALVRSRDIASTVRAEARKLETRGRALVIGIGTGESALAAAEAGFAGMTVAEGSRAALEAARNAQPAARLWTSPAINVLHADGRALLRRDDALYDFVLVDEPEVSGPESAATCTREFYALVASRLAAGGVLAQHLALERLSPVALASILASARAELAQLEVVLNDNSAILLGCRECRLPARDADDAGSRSQESRIDADGVAELLESVAKRLEVPADSFVSGDGDMFVAYQAPVSFRADPAVTPDSRALLESFASPRPASPALEVPQPAP